MWECYNLHFLDEKLGAHSSRVTFPRMQSNLGHNYVNTQADHWSQLLPGGPSHTPAYSHLPLPCAGISTGRIGESEQETNTAEK